MEIKEAQELLSALPAREQLEALIDYGKQLKEFSETEKKEENKVVVREKETGLYKLNIKAA